MSPFQAMYGRPPPVLPTCLAGSSNIASIDDTLLTHKRLLEQLKANLEASQHHMNTSANKHRIDKNFQPGEWVYVKLHIYKQASVVNRHSHKLSRWYFGPFKIVARIGKVAYRLDLPLYIRIHQVFHVSLLRPCYSDPNNQHKPLPAIALRSYYQHPSSASDHRAHLILTNIKFW